LYVRTGWLDILPVHWIQMHEWTMSVGVIIVYEDTKAHVIR